MTSRHFKIIVSVSWSIIVVCTSVLFYLAVAGPNVISANIVANLDKHVQAIRASTNLHEVQEIAVWRTQEGAYVTSSARILLVVASISLVLCMIGSGIGLFQIRQLKQRLTDKSEF